MINKDTAICISIAEKSGNFGTRLHNAAFKELELNFIYKACSVTDLRGAITGIKALGIRGAGVTMPYKKRILDLVDIVDLSADSVGAANTIVNNYGILTAYNTDVFSTTALLKEKDSSKPLFILGRGGFAASVEHSAKLLGFNNISFIDRISWNQIKDIKNSTIFNCTPVRDVKHSLGNDNEFIDCHTTSRTGARMAILQATKQFELYTGEKFPMHIIDETTWKIR